MSIITFTAKRKFHGPAPAELGGFGRCFTQGVGPSLAAVKRTSARLIILLAADSYCGSLIIN